MMSRVSGRDSVCLSVAPPSSVQAWAYSRLSAAKAVVEDDFTLSDDWPSIANLTACVAELEAR